MVAETLTLVLAGSSIPMRPQTSRRGNTYFAVLAQDAEGNRFNSPYGVEIKPLAGELPRVATVEGELIQLEEVDDSGRRVGGQGSLEVLGQPYRVLVRVTRRRNDNWQLKAVAHVAPDDPNQPAQQGALDVSEL